MKTYRFLSNSELPDNLTEILESKSGILTYSEILHTYKEMDYAEAVNLSLYSQEKEKEKEPPAAVLLEVEGEPEKLKNILEFGDAILFPKNTELNITKIDEIKLSDRKVIRLAVNPQPKQPKQPASPVVSSTSQSQSNIQPSQQPQQPQQPQQTQKPAQQVSAKPVLTKDDYSKELTEHNKKAAKQEAYYASALADSGHIVHGDTLFHDLDTVPEDVAQEGLSTRSKHPKKYIFYKVDMHDDPTTGKLIGKWGYANPRDLLYLPGRDSKQREPHTLRTHKDVGQVVPPWILAKIIAGIQGSLENTSKVSHVYINLNNNERHQGYGLFALKDEPYLDKPFPTDQALRFYANFFTRKAIVKLKKSQKKNGLPPDIKEDIARKSLEKLYDSLASINPNYENYKELAKKYINHSALRGIIDPEIDAVFNKNKDATARKILPPRGDLVKVRGFWRTFEHVRNTTPKLANEEYVTRKLTKRVGYDPNTGKLGQGQEKPLIEHLLDYIKKYADRDNNDRYRATLGQLQSVETALKGLGQDPNALTTKRQLLEHTVDQYLQLKDKALVQKRIRDSLNIFYLMAVANGLRAQNESKDTESKKEKKGDIKQGAATLTPNNISFGDDEGNPYKTYVHFLKTKTGNRAQFINYDRYINAMLRRSKAEIETRKKFRDQLGDLLPENIRNHIMQYFIDSKKVNPGIAKKMVEGDFINSSEELKDSRLFAHEPEDFRRAVYGGWDKFGQEHGRNTSNLFHILNQAGFTQPEGKEDPKINAQLLRKFNVNLRASNEAQIHGANLFLNTRGLKKLMLNRRILEREEPIVRKIVAASTGHSPDTANSYLFPHTIERNIVRGYRRARQYFKTHGRLLTAKEYRDIFLS